MIDKYTENIITSYRKMTGNISLSVDDYLKIRDQSIKEISLGYAENDNAISKTYPEDSIPKRTTKTKRVLKENSSDTEKKISGVSELSDFELLKKINDPWS